MRAVRQIATPPSSLCKEPTASLHNIEKKNSQPKRNPAPTPGSIPPRSAPPRRNCKRSAGPTPLDPLNRQHSFCLGAPPRPSFFPNRRGCDASCSLPLSGGGKKPPRPRTAPALKPEPPRRPNEKSADSTLFDSPPSRRESILRQNLSPERATALFAPHGGPSNPISPDPKTAFAQSRPTPPPNKRTSVESKEFEPKKIKKPKTPGPSSLRSGLPPPSRILPPPPPERLILNNEGGRKACKKRRHQKTP